MNKSDFDLWHPIDFFSKKIITIKIEYKTYNAKLLAIVEAFKTWRYYLESCKHQSIILTNDNNLCQFIDVKNLSFY